MARILVIDDDPDILEALEIVLREHFGHEVSTAQGGEPGLEQAKASPPDLIILDVLMPGMDGWTVLKRLRSDPDLALVPVVYLSAVDSDTARARGFQLGADDHLGKPFSVEGIGACIDRVLARRAALQRTIEKHASASGVTSKEPAFEGDLGQIGVASLLLLLEAEDKTGILDLTAADGAGAGQVFFIEGQIVQAQLKGRPPIKGAEAIFTALGWTRGGAFRFNPELVYLEDAIGQTTTQLLLEGARRIDESIV